jgi:hypothetical protein
VFATELCSDVESDVAVVVTRVYFVAFSLSGSCGGS